MSRNRNSRVLWAMLCRDDPFPELPICGSADGSLAIYRTKEQAVRALMHPVMAHDYPVMRVRVTLLGERPKPTSPPAPAGEAK